MSETKSGRNGARSRSYTAYWMQALLWSLLPGFGFHVVVVVWL